MFKGTKATVRRSTSVRRKPASHEIELRLTEEDILRDLLSFGPVDDSFSDRPRRVGA